MSGGPVFDMSGQLMGLICSAIEFGKDEGVSYVSLIWPCLTTQFDGIWPNGLYKSKIDLLSLKDTCFIDKREAIKVSRDLKNNRIETSYEKWE